MHDHAAPIRYKEIEIEDGMRWLQLAPDRIRRNRMGRFRLTFTDKDGWPIDKGAKAAVALRRHAFPLGTSLRTKRASAMDDNDYRWCPLDGAENPSPSGSLSTGPCMAAGTFQRR